MSNNNSKNLSENNRDFQATSENAAVEDIRRMFVDEIQVSRIVNENQTPAKRAAFAKTHGSVYGTFQVSDNLPEQYQVGIFKPGKSYSAWVRYSSDIAQTADDYKSTVGIGIKLFDVPGKKMLANDVDATTLDFILQNTQVFFASDAVEMAEFKAAAMSGKLDAFLLTHPDLAAVLDSMSKKVDSLLTEPLWSCVPFKFGNNYCKFKIAPESVPSPSSAPDLLAKDYLAHDLADRLMNGEVRLNFYVQIRNNPATQSIISARSLWNETEAVPVKVATLILYKQNINARQQQAYAESLSFNLWRTLAEMEPVGSIAEARKVTYQSSAQMRRNVNGQSIGEPTISRPPQLSGLPVFKPTTEKPWPIGTFSNATEDFSGVGQITLLPNQYTRALTELTVSARDVTNSVFINIPRSVGPTMISRGITYLNSMNGTGSLRILFEKNQMIKVSFDLLLAPINQSGRALTVRAYRDNQFLISVVVEANSVVGNIIIDPPHKVPFDLLTFDFGADLSGFNLNNFQLTYA